MDTSDYVEIEPNDYIDIGASNLSVINPPNDFSQDLSKCYHGFTGQKLLDLGFLHTEEAENDDYNLTYPFVPISQY